MNSLELEPALAPRAPGCLSEYALERLRHDELRGARAQDHRRHLGACPTCRARLQALAAEVPPALDFAAVAAAVSGPALQPAVRATAAGSPRARSFWHRFATWSGWWRFGWVGVAGAGVALLLALDLDSGARRKGAPWELGVVVRRAEHGTERALPGERLRPGDRLRFEVLAPSDGFVSVISLDAAGVVTPFVPAAGAALPVARGQRTLLGGAVALDETVGKERLLLVACGQRFDVDAVVRAARQRLAAAGGHIGQVQDLGLGCEQRSFWIEKVAP